MTNSLLSRLRERARQKPRRIVLPEANDPRVREAASQCLRDGLVEPILLETERLQAGHSKFAKAYYERGHMYFHLDRSDEALADFDRTIALDPNYARAHSFKGRTYAGLKRDDEALIEYARAIEIDPNFAGSHYALGTALASLGEYSQAQAALEEAVRLAPKNPMSDRGLLIQLLIY